ncbi:MAG: hypothetical protein L6R35_002089 [Caloplaca aegaea]|nr:MAG: hypothetical protein L6R35_002089 [Caloplaca aegaea]
MSDDLRGLGTLLELKNRRDPRLGNIAYLILQVDIKAPPQPAYSVNMLRRILGGRQRKAQCHCILPCGRHNEKSGDIVNLICVISYASAGLLRYHDRPIRQVSPTFVVADNQLTSTRRGLYVRSYNQSTIAVESVPTTALLLPTSTTAQSLSTTQEPDAPLSKQVGSVPAEGSGPGAAKIDTASLEQLTSAPPLASPTSSPATLEEIEELDSTPTQGSALGSAATTSETSVQTPSSAESTAALSSSSPIAPNPRSSLGTGVATPAPQPQKSQVSPETSLSNGVAQSSAATAQIQGTSPTTTSSVVPTAASVAATSSDSKTSSAQTAGPSLSEIPVTEGGNVAIANAYNQEFKKLTEGSRCSAKDLNKAHACIDGLFAECNNAGQYTTTACSGGQKCFALPMPSGSTGIFVQCENPSEASRKLQLNTGGGSSPSVSPASATGSVPSNAESSSSAVSTTTSILSAPSQAQDKNTQTTGPATVQTIIPTTTTATSSVTQTTPAEPNNEDEPASTPLVSQQPSATAVASSTDVPLIISFPSLLSSTVPPPSPSPSKPTIIQNSATASMVPTSVPPQEPPTLPSPPQQPPTSAPNAATSVASAVAPGITIVPLGGDGDKETVTMTVTTTERI